MFLLRDQATMFIEQGERKQEEQKLDGRKVYVVENLRKCTCSPGDCPGSTRVLWAWWVSATLGAPRHFRAQRYNMFFFVCFHTLSEFSKVS